MHDGVLFLLDLGDGPIFRFAFALMVLGSLRAILLKLSEAVGAYLTIPDRRVFWQRFRMRLMWLALPSVVMRRHRPGGSLRMFAYHLSICCVSLVFRVSAILVPAFMVAHVYLWERNLGLSWPTLPTRIADVLAVTTVVAGLVLFLARLYSPLLRRIEPPWSFLKPLVLILPFITGMLATHPQWSPFDYHVVRLMHAFSAAAVFVMIPFARMLTCVHTPLTEVIPEADWRAPGDGTPQPGRIPLPSKG
jgi:hypothetical protein